VNRENVSKVPVRQSTLAQTLGVGVLWNTIYLERAVNALRGHGQGVDDTLLRYLSPLGWEHINLIGDYLWRSGVNVGGGKFRSLRTMQTA
jgi:hypothetical protein